MIKNLVNSFLEIAKKFLVSFGYHPNKKLRTITLPTTMNENKSSKKPNH